MNLLRGGKTTAPDLFRREIGARVVVVHEAAIAGFFEAVGSNGEQQLGRYDAVIFFESAAVGGVSVEGGNPTRIESNEQALALDQRLREIWSEHPRFVVAPHNPLFVKKVMVGLAVLESMVAQLHVNAE